MTAKSRPKIERYGKAWFEDKFPHPALIDLWCYARHGEALEAELGKRHCLSPDDFLRSAIRQLYPDFSLNNFSNAIIDLWCGWPIGVVWGCTSSGKSYTTGLLALLDILPAPQVTYTCLITSPMREHPGRSWGKILSFYARLPECLKIGVIKEKPDLGLHTTGKEAERAGIHCYSTNPGEPAEDFKKRVGAHQKRNRLIVDETQKCSESVLSAISNLGGFGAYKEFHIFNPSSWFTTDGKASMPAAPITPKQIEIEELDEWLLARSFRGKHGKAIVLDGEKNPALEDPSLEGKLIDKHHRETIIATHGEDSFEYWANFRGRMPPEGAVAVFVTRQDLESAGCFDPFDPKTLFMGPTTDLAGLDPSQGVDDCMNIRIRIGQHRETGRQIIAIIQKERIDIRLKQGDISGQISTKMVENLRRWQLPIKNLGVDATGETSQSDTIERDFGSKGVHRVFWQGPPSKRRVSASGETAEKFFNDRATELFAQVAMLARQGRIFGIDDAIAHQLTTRRKLTNAGRSKVEPKDGKDGWRERNAGKSPNDLDSLIAAVEVAIARKLIQPFLPVATAPNRNRQGFNQKPGSNFANRIRKASRIAAIR